MKIFFEIIKKIYLFFITLVFSLNASLMIPLQSQTDYKKNNNADLINAIINNDLSKIKDILTLSDVKNKINFENSSGMTPLIVAVYTNQKEIVEFLIDNGADIDYKTFHYQYTALMEALFEGNREMVNLLIKKGANTSGYDISGVDYLFDLKNFKKLDQQAEDRFRKLLNFVGDPNIVKDRKSLLMLAFGFGLDDIMFNLLKSPANDYVKKKYDKKFNYYNPKIINILLKAGANINFKNEFDQSVYLFASQHNKKQIIFDYIYDLINQLEVVFKNHENLDFNICYAKFKEIILKIGSVRIRDKNKNNLLHYAFKSGNLNFVKIIYQMAPDLIHQVNNFGQTPISLIFSKSSSYQELLDFVKLESLK